MSYLLPPLTDPHRAATSQDWQDDRYTIAAELSRPVEAFADWLGTVWDFDPDAVDDHDIATLRQVAAWAETMPENLRGAFLAHVKRERAAWRRRNPGEAQRPLTVMGVTLPGVPAA